MMFSLSGNKVSLGRTIPVPLTPKPVYAFDIDGVLCSTKEVHRAALEAELGGVTLHDGGHYDAFGFHHDSDEILEEVRRIALDLWRRPTVFANGEASGQAVVRELYKRAQLAGYVTRRHPDLTFDTGLWLRTNGFVDVCYYDLPKTHPGYREGSIAAPRVGKGDKLTLLARHEKTCSKLEGMRACLLAITGMTIVTQQHEDGLRSMIDDLKTQLVGIEAALLAKPDLVPLHHMLGDAESKADVARAMGADTLVEDSPHEALLAARDGLRVVVVRQPYNKDFEQQCKLGRLTNVPPSDPDYLTYFRIRFISALQELL